MSYSVKMRERAIEAMRNGHSKAEVNEMLCAWNKYAQGVGEP